MSFLTTTWHIYSLTDPRDGRVRYVGKTNHIKRREYSHVNNVIRKHDNSHRACWIRSLVRLGLRPSMSILEVGVGDWQEAERKWIRYFRDAGAKLTNATDGGEGLCNPSPETLAKMRAPKTDEARANMSKAALSVSPEERARRTARLQETKTKSAREAALRTPEVEFRRLSRLLSPEVQSRIRSKILGRKHTDEAKERMSAAQKGHLVLQDTRDKISAGNRGKVRSPELRARIAATCRVSLKAYWAKRKAERCHSS